MARPETSTLSGGSRRGLCPGRSTISPLKSATRLGFEVMGSKPYCDSCRAQAERVAGHARHPLQPMRPIPPGGSIAQAELSSAVSSRDGRPSSSSIGITQWLSMSQRFALPARLMLRLLLQGPGARRSRPPALRAAAADHSHRAQSHLGSRTARPGETKIGAARCTVFNFAGSSTCLPSTSSHATETTA